MSIFRNTFVIFLLSGFWHGANWTFIAWGAYHAVLFLPLILLGMNRKYTNQVAEGRWLPTWKETGQILLTFMLAVIGWIIFRATSIAEAWSIMKGICDVSLFSMPMITGGFMRRIYFIIIMLVIEWVNRDKEHGLANGNFRKYDWLRIVLYYTLCLLIFRYAGPEQEFIYFQF